MTKSRSAWPTVWEIATDGRLVKVTLLDCWQRRLRDAGSVRCQSRPYTPLRPSICRFDVELLPLCSISGYPGAFGEPPLIAGGRRD